MNIREHLDSICDVKVWWGKKKVIKIRVKPLYGQDWNAITFARKAFRGFSLTNKVLYVCYHEEETTGYIVGGNGTIEYRFLLLRSPNDKDNKRILWREIAKEVKSHYYVDPYCVYLIHKDGRCFTDTRPPYSTLT